ncbi:MAG: heavy-metal-associated domain-containing protein, partial [Firmicutes bacterium]|nr:heavy-metal-associated domain-containing protein [Bacillota bacterium]
MAGVAGRSQVTLRVEGMTCDGCARHVARALRDVRGVIHSRVPNWRAGQATVLAEDVEDEALVQAVERAGYRAAVVARRPVAEERGPDREGRGDWDLMV